MRLLSFMGDAEVTLDFKDEKLLASVAGARGSFSLAGAEDVPMPSWPKPSQLAPSPDGLLAAIRFAVFSADASGRAGPLSSVCLDGRGAWATDGARVTFVALKGSALKQQVLVPASVVAMLPVGDEPVSWGVVEGVLWLVWGQQKIWSRLLEPPFPDVSPVFQRATALAKKGGLVVEYDSTELASVAEVAASAGGSPVLRGRVEKGTLQLSCRGETAEAQVERKVTAGGSRAFAVDAAKFQEAVSRFPRMAICGEGMLLFGGSLAGGHHVLMEVVDQPEEHHEATAAE